VNFLTAPFLLIWRHRFILINTVRSDLRTRYAGSILGIGWMVIYPLLFLAAYSLVYLYIFQSRNPAIGTGGEYVLFIFCGLIPFLSFAEAIAVGTPSVVANSNLIKNTLYPVELLPVKTVLVAQGTPLVGLAVLLIALGAAERLTWWALLLPAVWLAQVVLTIGIVWILAATNVFLRDLQHMVAIFMLALMMLSPIAYTIDALPARLAVFLKLNPLCPIIVSCQDILFFGRFPRGETIYVLAGISLFFFCSGYWYFRRLKQVFAENV